MDSDRSAPPSPPSHRLWIPATIAILVLIGIVFVQWQPELERNFKAWIIASIPVLAFILVFLWFILLSRFRWRTRLLTAGGVAAVVSALTLLVRVDGSLSGTGLPRLAWKWSPARSGVVETTARSPVSDSTTAQTAENIPDVPQFFGPNRDGIIPAARLARDWNARPPRLLWKQPIGLGWSAFAVVGGHAFTQEQRGSNELVTCYALLSGRLLWSSSNRVCFSQWQGGAGPRATPTIFQGRVFAMGGSGILDCLDAATGKRFWSHEVLKDTSHANLIWGMSCSPLVFNDTVVVTGGRCDKGTVIAYRLSTGEVLWKSGNEMASYASPVLTTLAAKRVILSLNAVNLTAHDPASGALLLAYTWASEKHPKASQPVVLPGDRIFLSAGYGAGCVLLQVTANKEGQMTATPIWKGLSMKTQFNSVAARDGFLYGLDDGLLCCVDLSNGKRRWKDGRYGSGQTLLVDDLILIQSERGRWHWPARRLPSSRNWAAFRHYPPRPGTIPLSQDVFCSRETTRNARVTNCPCKPRFRRPANGRGMPAIKLPLTRKLSELLFSFDRSPNDCELFNI